VLAGDAAATTVVLHVDDGAVEAPAEATIGARSFDASLLLEGPSLEAQPRSDACYTVDRRVLKAGVRAREGARTSGFTWVCACVRAPSTTHEDFDAYWRDRHGPLHVRWSPGTCHYEQLVLHECRTSGATAWDGIGYLSFASVSDFNERLFDGA